MTTGVSNISSFQKAHQPASSSPPSFQGAAGPALNQLQNYDLTGRSSPNLSKRVSLESTKLNLRFAKQIAAFTLTNEVREWLSSLGWADEDLESLSQSTGTESFLSALFDQACHQESQIVLDHLPPSWMEQTKIELQEELEMLEALIDLIRPEGKSEFDIVPNMNLLEEHEDKTVLVPLGPYFLYPKEREANRNLYFPNGHYEESPALLDWLAQRGWHDSDLNSMKRIENAISKAITYKDFAFIQSLPRQHAVAILDTIALSILLNRDLFHFSESYRKLVDMRPAFK